MSKGEAAGFSASMQDLGFDEQMCPADIAKDGFISIFSSPSVISMIPPFHVLFALTVSRLCMAAFQRMRTLSV